MPTSTIILNPPSLDVQLDGSGFYATKSWLAIELAALRLDLSAGFPADAEVVRAWIASQQMDDYPTGCYGDITWSVAPPLYAKLAKLPEKERCQPIDSGFLGQILFRPGAALKEMNEFLYPIPCPPGSRIGLYPEIKNAPNRFLSIFTGLAMRSATGFTELPGIVYHDVPNKSTSAAGAYSFRCTLSDIPEGGSEVRVTSVALKDGCSMPHQSIGVRNGSSGFNMKAAPVQLSYDGSPALTLGALTYKRSAWAPLSTAAGDALLVHSCVNDCWAFKDCAISDGNPGAYVAGTSGYDQQNFSGTAQVIPHPITGVPTWHRKHVVAMVEVR